MTSDKQGPEAEPAVTAEEQAVAAAMAALAAGRLDEAEAALVPWAMLGERVETYTTLAHVIANRGRHQEAVELLVRAEGRFPTQPRVWRALAALYRLMRRTDDEVEYRRKLVFLVPEPPVSDYLKFAAAYVEVHRDDADVGWGELRFVSRKISALALGDESARTERLALAQTLYQVKALADEAYRHCFEASPSTPAWRDLSVGWARLDRWCERAGLPVVRSATLGRLGCRPMLAELKRVAVLPGLQWSPVIDESNVAIDGFANERLKFNAVDPTSPLLLNRAHRRAELRLPRELPVVTGPALLLGGVPEYFGQTVEHLGMLAVAETLGVPPNLPLVVNDALTPFQLEQFALLGIAEDRLIRVKADEPVRFERLWVATKPVDLQGRYWVDPLLPAWCRERFRVARAGAARKLYVSRGAGKRRRIANEAEVVERLAARGYEVVDPEPMSVRQQIELFSQASDIVAPLGAALTNMIFASAGARIVAICNRAFAALDSTIFFDALADASGHAFRRIDAIGVAMHEGGRSIDADVEVDLGALEQALG